MKKIIIEIVTWLAIEVLLNVAGLSDLGNYSEFVFAPKNISLTPTTEIALII